MKQQGHTLNGPVVRAFRTHLLKSTIADAAAKIDVSHGLWSQWENGGRAISTARLESLTELFGLDSSAPLLAETAAESIREVERQRARRNKGAA